MPPAAETTDSDLLVLGAGPAGVAAAQRAAMAGHRVTVVEREHRIGGAAGSLELGGMRVDLGSHRLHRSIDPLILDELRRLLGDDLQTRERHGRIRLAGRWLPFPLRPAATLRSLPAGFAVRSARDALAAPWRTPRADTFAEVVRAGLGPTMAARFYGPYARKLWGLDPDEISGEQARRRVGAASAGAVLARVVRGAAPEARTFLYPRRGFGQLWESLAASAQGHGAAVRLGTSVTAISAHDDGVTVRAGDTILHARRVWSTVPLPVLARLHDPPAPAPVRAAAGALEVRAMVLVYLVLGVPRWTRYDAHYLPEGWTPVTRVSEPKNYRDGQPGPSDPGDPPDRTVLCAEIPCTVDDPVWRSEDAELGRLVVEGLRGAGLAVPSVREVASHRLPSAYPVYRVGFERHLAVLDTWAASLPRVLTFGRQGLFVHDNSHHALAMAWAAADALRPDGGFDQQAWGAARARFAAHVVED